MTIHIPNPRVVLKWDEALQEGSFIMQDASTDNPLPDVDLSAWVTPEFSINLEGPTPRVTFTVPCVGGLNHNGSEVSA